MPWHYSSQSALAYTWGMFAVIIGSLLLGDVLAWRMAIRHLRGNSAPRGFLWACHAFFAIQTAYALTLVLLAFAGSAGMRARLNWIPTSLLALIYVWHLAVLPLSLIIWLVVGFVTTARRLVRLALAAKAPPVGLDAPDVPAQPDPQGPTADPPARISRRNVLKTSIATMPPLLALGATGYALHEVADFRVNRMRLPVAGLPSGLEGFRIAHVSDLHVGKWSSQEFLDNVIERTNALSADVVLFTGDLIDLSISYLPTGVDVIKRLQARHGVYMIEGNHDLFDDAIAFRRTLISEGLRFLRGTSATIVHRGTPLQLLGLPWSRSDSVMRDDIQQLASQRDPAAYPILMAHHPHAFDPAADAGFPITLSGHTHGGQLAINRDLCAGSLMFRYISGIYQKGTSRLLVSNGTGNWFPLRINAPAEIIDITLTHAPESLMV